MLKLMGEVVGLAPRFLVVVALLVGLVLAVVYVPQLARLAAFPVPTAAGTPVTQIEFITIVLTTVAVILASGPAKATISP